MSYFGTGFGSYFGSYFGNIGAVVPPEPLPPSGGGGAAPDRRRNIDAMLDRQEAETAWRASQTAPQPQEVRGPRQTQAPDLPPTGKAGASLDAILAFERPADAAPLPDIAVPTAIEAKTEAEFEAAFQAALQRSPAAIIAPGKRQDAEIQAADMNLRLLLLLAT